ncbi:flagellar hook-length control protein FliK [Methylomarinovum caldicuralii]|uniref:Flagellar hook-length control protein FliK n=1 Tax=Methylomarinovum caldicuralii TaxID=438856 RepID=A0AAU9CJ57_9GAMM|nr:flagellar hook-length control protein FliK [Methylomarinovum caldicuralii]BCX81646.1 flagellar hook-length control protein FliK [Methylomarinovum caldicuralii]
MLQLDANGLLASLVSGLKPETGDLAAGGAETPADGFRQLLLDRLEGVIASVQEGRTGLDSPDLQSLQSWWQELGGKLPQDDFLSRLDALKGYLESQGEGDGIGASDALQSSGQADFLSRLDALKGYLESQGEGDGIGASDALQNPGQADFLSRIDEIRAYLASLAQVVEAVSGPPAIAPPLGGDAEAVAEGGDETRDREVGGLLGEGISGPLFAPLHPGDEADAPVPADTETAGLVASAAASGNAAASAEPKTEVVPSAAKVNDTPLPAGNEERASFSLPGNDADAGSHEASPLPDGVEVDAAPLRPMPETAPFRPLPPHVRPPAAAASVTVERPVGHTGWGDELGERLVWMADRSLQVAELRVHPQHLGPVEVRIRIQDDQTHIQFNAQHGVVREAIEAALPRLREVFAAQQLTLGQVEVNADAWQGQGQSQRQQDSSRHQRQAPSGEAAGDAVDLLRQTADEPASPASGNRLVSLYA